MKTNALATMPLSHDLAYQNCMMKVDCLSMFLDKSIKAITAMSAGLTEAEKYGFHICIMLLAQHVENAIGAGEILQEMGASNG